jgi:thiol-disulfide isomerase/thioredoxin
MISSRLPVIGLVLCASLSLCWGVAVAQQKARVKPGIAPPAALQQGEAGGRESLQSINDDYNRRVLELERRRLERLGQLAGRQAPREADETYEMLFRLAIANNLFAEAEPAADRILQGAGSPAPDVLFLAQTINIIATADRGAYDESLAELRTAILQGPERNQLPSKLDTPSLLGICGAYYQRLVQGGRFDIARKAFQLIANETKNPAVKQFCTDRLDQLNLVGKPAPALRGTDLDGKPVSLDALKGNVVLIVFWASWCLPNAQEVAWLDQAYIAYRDKGFRIVGVNLDTLQNGNTKLETVLPNIRRFLVDHNIRWPNLVNGQGANDYAKAYGVTAIPTNVLVGPDGTVIHLDLSRKNLDQVIARAVVKP